LLAPICTFALILVPNPVPMVNSSFIIMWSYPS
jgi:hypothetical protein